MQNGMISTPQQLTSLPHYDNFEEANTLLAHLPGIVLFKNIDLIYTATSNYAARLCGFNNNHQFSGHDDFELRCGAVESAIDFRKEDLRVITTDKEMTCLQIHQFADGNIRICIMRKAPSKNSHGQITGVCSIGNEVINPQMGKAIFNLLTLGNPVYNIKKICNVNFDIDANETFNQLSPREAELMFYFMRGFGIKEIGGFMELSPRTVESYLETVKNKFKCATRNELLLHCMQEGFAFIIPQNIFQRLMNKSISW